ncbi:MAG: hypothetical protein WBW38_13075 [Candidatus Sulfotelmatobacter sp.]
MSSSVWTNARRFAYWLPAVHFAFLVAICLTDVNEIVPKIGIIDFPLTILASPVLMNVDFSAVWVVLYYFISGSMLWYFVGKVLDRLVGTAK